MSLGERLVYRGVVFCLTASILAACNTTHILPTPLPDYPTVAPLTQTATYWDAGIQLSYPANWAAPIYLSGEMLLAPNAADASKTPPTDPIVTVQVSTLTALNATKDTTLLALLQKVSGANSQTDQIAQALTNFGGLDANYSILHDRKADFYEQTVLFRLPDGRIAWLIVLVPGATWGDFAPTADQIRAGGKLVKSTDYSFTATASTAQANQSVRYVAGGLRFTLPQGWVSKTVDSAGTVLYHEQNDRTYQDNSGFSNGPQLVIHIQKTSAPNAGTALSQFLQVPAASVRSFIVNGQPGAEFDTTDPATGQVIVFIGILGTDNTTLSVLRWTTPILISLVVRPILDTAVQSMSFTPPGSLIVPIAPATPGR